MPIFHTGESPGAMAEVWLAETLRYLAYQNDVQVTLPQQGDTDYAAVLNEATEAVAAALGLSDLLCCPVTGEHEDSFVPKIERNVAFLLVGHIARRRA